MYASTRTIRENCELFVKGWVQYREHIMELFRYKMTSSPLLYHNSKSCRYSAYRPALPNVHAPLTGPGLLQSGATSSSNHVQQATILPTHDQAKATIGRHIVNITVEKAVPVNMIQPFGGSQNNQMPPNHNENLHVTQGQNLNSTPSQQSPSHQSNTTWYANPPTTPIPSVSGNSHSSQPERRKDPVYTAATSTNQPIPTVNENNEPKRPPRAQTAVAGSRPGSDATEQMRIEKEILEQKVGEMTSKMAELANANRKLQKEKAGLLDQ